MRALFPALVRRAAPPGPAPALAPPGGEIRARAGRLGLSGDWTLLIFSLPVITGLVNRVVRGGVWFTDYDALVCGAQRAAAGAALYDQSAACANRNAAAFVYTPWVARISGVLLEGLGQDNALGAYVALYVAAAALMVWAAVLRRDTPGTPRARARFMALVSGSAVTTGNIASLLHGAVAATALIFRHAPWGFVLVVAAAGAVKPVFLTYLAVVVLARRSLVWRAGALVLGLGLGLAPTALFLSRGGPEVAAWRDLLSHFVCRVTPGDGLFGWLTWAGIPTEGARGAILALAWAGLVTLCGLVIAERERLSDESRLWLGLACAVLANPRLMSEDLFLVGPGLLVAVGALQARRPGIAFWLARAVATFCVLALAGHLLDFADYGPALALLGLALAFIVCGLICAMPWGRAS